MSGKYKVKIGDFGLASKIGETSQDAVGTTLYLAPEVKEGEFTEKADVYALGLILLEMVAGFETQAERFLAFRELEEKGSLPADIDKEEKTLIELITKRNPKERPSLKKLKLSPELSRYRGKIKNHLTH